MDELVDTVRQDIPRAFESDDYTERMEAAMQRLQTQRQELTDALDKVAIESGFALRFTQAGIASFPVKDGQPLSDLEYAALPEAEQESIREKAIQLQQAINRTLADIRRLGKAAQEETRRVDREIVRFALNPIINELQDKYSDYPDVVAYLDLVETDMVNHLDEFKPRDPVMGPLVPPAIDEDVFMRCRVNDLIDNTACDSVSSTEL